MSSKTPLWFDPLFWGVVALTIVPIVAYAWAMGKPPDYNVKKREYYEFTSKSLLSGVSCDRCKTIIGDVCNGLDDAEKIKCINILSKLSVEKNWEELLKNLPENRRKLLVERVKLDLKKLSKGRGIKFE